MWILTEWNEAVNLAHAVKLLVRHEGNRAVVVASTGDNNRIAIRTYETDEEAQQVISRLCSTMNLEVERAYPGAL